MTSDRGLIYGLTSRLCCKINNEPQLARSAPAAALQMSKETEKYVYTLTYTAFENS